MRRTTTLLAAASLALAAAVQMRDAGSDQGSARSEEPRVSQAQVYFTDVALINQDGEEMRFYSDLLRGKVVVINTIFTTCTSVCPVMSEKFNKVQEHLGDRLGRDVHLISISVDPENDTPRRLKEFSDRYGARPGWYFLTGTQANVRFALEKLGSRIEDKESHQTIILVGNEPTGLWKKVFGLGPAESIIQAVDSVLHDDAVTPTVGSGGR